MFYLRRIFILKFTIKRKIYPFAVVVSNFEFQSTMDETFFAYVHTRLNNINGKISVKKKLVLEKLQ